LKPTLKFAKLLSIGCQNIVQDLFSTTTQMLSLYKKRFFSVSACNVTTSTSCKPAVVEIRGWSQLHKRQLLELRPPIDWAAVSRQVEHPINNCKAMYNYLNQLKTGKSHKHFTNRKWTDSEIERLNSLVETHSERGIDGLRKLTGSYRRGLWTICADVLQRSDSECRHFFMKQKPTGRHNWTDEECQKLDNLYSFHGDFAPAAAELQRTVLSCRYKWYELIKAKRKGRWSTEEESMLLQLVKVHGRSWSYLQRFFNGRTNKQLYDKFVALSKVKSKPVWKKWSKNEERLLIKSVSNGNLSCPRHERLKTWKDVAELLGRSQHSCRLKFTRLSRSNLLNMKV
jgi:hypothetical protein